MWRIGRPANVENVAENCVAFSGIDQTLFVIGVCFRFLACDKAGAYDTTLRTQAKDCGQASAVHNATRSENRDWCNSFHDSGQQCEQRRFAAVMPSCLGALGDNNVDTRVGCCPGLDNGPNLEHHFSPGGVTPFDQRYCVTPEKRNHRHLFLNADSQLTFEASCGADRWDQVNSKRPIGEFTRSPDLHADEFRWHADHCERS
jgi:hypothetical protein